MSMHLERTNIEGDSHSSNDVSNTGNWTQTDELSSVKPIFPSNPVVADTAQNVYSTVAQVTSEPGVPESKIPSRHRGDTFADYEILSEVARGGMGVVYKARQKSLNRIVALKMVLPEIVNSSLAIERFYQEARAAASLDHPNIVPIFEIGESNSQHYFTMAFIEGESLKGRIRHNRPSVRETVRLMIGIADGVAFAHKQGIIHRDLKPDNVLIDLQGRPRVTDFGLAKQVEVDTGLTATGAVMGTPTFMAPEQALGGKRQIGPPADVYALGGILFNTLTGRAPFTGDTMTEVLCQVISSPAPSLREFEADIPEELEKICLKCLEKDPANRFPSAEAFRDALIAWETQAIAQEAISQTKNINPHKQPSGKFAVDPSLPSLLIASPEEQGPQGNFVVTSKSRTKQYLLLTFVLLVAVVAVVATQLPKSETPTTESTNVAEKPVASIATPSTSETTPEPKAEVKIKVETPRKQEIPLLVPERKDFGLKLEMLGGKVDEHGVRQFREGQIASFKITVDKDAYVALWSLNANGTVVQIFPNQYESEHLVKAGEPRTVPGKDAEIELTASEGIDQVWAVASTRPWDPLQGGKEGPFTIFKDSQERNRFEQHTRDMRLRPKTVQVAEDSLKYEVKK